ncbi:MAG TPA: hypothetical protein PLP61_06235 [Nocardioides sp.]|uniref:hypothetical protein n=1 Tax=Nocardioides sp. TaxID=35761 RepID=UPI002CBAF2E0|nr:hypothetical protein [Nocardioides sp.]HQR26623.1 hypothetical protein [Nocardioides sp.]
MRPSLPGWGDVSLVHQQRELAARVEVLAQDVAEQRRLTDRSLADLADLEQVVGRLAQHVLGGTDAGGTRDGGE